jgi:DNA-binding transcriptional regulator YdaS (Cro superfamily)
MNTPLSRWQKENRITNRALSVLIGVHESFITHINKGRRRPSAALALRIEQATNGAVTRMELLYPDQKGEGAETR